MNTTVVHNPNAGNSCHTYFKASGDRPYCICLNADYARDSKGRVRRFASRTAAEKAATALSKGGAK